MFRKPVAYISAYNSVLVCHSEKNRIGIYDAKTLKFLSWLQHPDTRNGSHFEYTDFKRGRMNRHYVTTTSPFLTTGFLKILNASIVISNGVE